MLAVCASEAATKEAAEVAPLSQRRRYDPRSLSLAVLSLSLSALLMDAGSPLADVPVSAYLSSPTDEFLPSRLRAFHSTAGDMGDEEGGASKMMIADAPKRTWIKWAVLAVVTVALIVAAVLVAKKVMAAEEALLEEELMGSAYRVKSQPKYVHNLTLPVRKQWNQNFGYCGAGNNMRTPL